MLQNMSRDDIEIYHYCDRATYTVQPHRHDFYELYCLLANGYTYHVEDKQYVLEPGTLVLVCPGETHWPELEGPPKDIDRIVLWLNPQFVSSLSIFLPKTLGAIDENLQDQHLIIPDAKTYQIILGLLYSLLYEKNRADADSQYLCHLILSQLLIHISRVLNKRARPAETPGSRYEEIMRVHEYINAHFRDPISVNSLAQLFFMDKNTMTRQFKRVVGMTPGDYIRRKRLESAYTLITQGYSVQHAGFVSGFTDYSAFYRAFRQRYGFSPGSLAAQSKSGTPNMSGQEGAE
jgi:AraC-like DNA-binding protein